MARYRDHPDGGDRRGALRANLRLGLQPGRDRREGVRITFQIEDVNAFDAETGHWKIEVQQSETELATQAVEIEIFAAEIDGVYEVKMANSDGVWFSPTTATVW